MYIFPGAGRLCMLVGVEFSLFFFTNLLYKKYCMWWWLCLYEVCWNGPAPVLTRGHEPLDVGLITFHFSAVFTPQGFRTHGVGSWCNIPLMFSPYVLYLFFLLSLMNPSYTQNYFMLSKIYDCILTIFPAHKWGTHHHAVATCLSSLNTWQPAHKQQLSVSVTCRQQDECCLLWLLWNL